MTLESVRELKQTVGARAIADAPRALVRASTFGVSAGTSTGAPPIIRSFAVGIAQHKRRDYKLAIRIQRRSLADTQLISQLQEQARGEVDIRYVGKVSKRMASPQQVRVRPVEIGLSVGHFNITAGTIGCFIQQSGVADIQILSNNHVLANENRGKKGDEVIQPGDFDHGRPPADTVATLTDFVKLQKRAANKVDAACASISSGTPHAGGFVRGVGTLTGATLGVDIGQQVQKLGRTTGHTTGRITAFELDNVVVGYEIGDLRFDDQIEVEGDGEGPFSEGGDSGSLIMDMNMDAVALLFAGGDQGGSNGAGLTYGNPIDTVLSALNASIIVS